jgi:hypothetical protein
MKAATASCTSAWLLFCRAAASSSAAVPFAMPLRSLKSRARTADWYTYTTRVALAEAEPSAVVMLYVKV